jgi:ankyrin repeat protein
VAYLIFKGANVNVLDNQGHTPLNLAVLHKDTAELLRKHGGKTGEEFKAERK